MGRLSASYLISRDRRFCLRFRIPADLRRCFGRDEMVRAVGTADPRAARVIAARLATKLSRLWAMARRQPDLSEDALCRRANDGLEAEIERARAASADDPDDSTQDPHRQMPEPST
ncbi:DUF6538 domain-containing protein [Roseomonas sp. AR75]|uniref:DUF6538 domain-containing protein n=1 Tax=Roseomonas sp. AR75 TaxID=2562311 RepID=UPI0034D22233